MPSSSLAVRKLHDATKRNRSQPSWQTEQVRWPGPEEGQLSIRLAAPKQTPPPHLDAKWGPEFSDLNWLNSTVPPKTNQSWTVISPYTSNSICHICLTISDPNLCYLGGSILKHYPLIPPLKLKCRNALSPNRFLHIICQPPPPAANPSSSKSITLSSDSKWVTSDSSHWSPGWERGRLDNGEHVSVLGQALTCLTPPHLGCAQRKSHPLGKGSYFICFMRNLILVNNLGVTSSKGMKVFFSNLNVIETFATDLPFCIVGFFDYDGFL